MGVCCSCTRQLVSKKKLRTKEETPTGGVDLDLTLIHPSIVCMGLPAEGLEAMYRNPYDEVVEYLDFRFGDRYMVYNLCSEKGHIYASTKFHGRVANFPFPDHHACPLSLIPKFIAHATAYLSSGQDHVVVIHCKAGKGRTGMLACCLLMDIDPRLSNSKDAIVYYGKARTSDGRGLTIPSQIRYVEYYEQLRLLSNKALPSHVPSIDLYLVTVRHIHDVATFSTVTFVFGSTFPDAEHEPLTVDVDDVGRQHDGIAVRKETTDDGTNFTIDFTQCPSARRIQGDVRIELKNGTGKGWVGALTFHTLFVKKFYKSSELDRLYKKPLPSSAGIGLDFSEVIDASLTES